MLRLVVFLYLLFGLNALYAAKLPALRITHLTGNFFVYTTYQVFEGTPFPANGMYLVTAEGAFMFDTPWDTTQFQPLLDSIQLKHGVKVVGAIATHNHEDRTAGLQYYRQQGIKTYTTFKTDSISKIKGEKRAEFLLTKDTTFRLGGYSFQTYYPGAGHTVDNIVVWFPEQKILYGGCFVKSCEAGNLGNISEANLQEWPTSVNNVVSLFPIPAYVIPGHQSWKNKTSLQHTLKLLRKNKNRK